MSLFPGINYVFSFLERNITVSKCAVKMNEGQSSLQLYEELLGSISRTLTSQRPILTHLNADTSWLLSLPYPPNAIKPLGRSRFNILVDPWFQGPQSDLASWFSCQWHAAASSVQTIAELNKSLADIERIACSVEPSAQDSVPTSPIKGTESYIDAITISHEFTDHCNKETLLELSHKTPIFATKSAAALIKSWNHFELVQETPPFSEKDSDWRETSLNPLPDWLGVSRMVTQSDTLYYHSAIMIAFDLYSTGHSRRYEISTPAEAIIYTPHGIHAQALQHLSSADPALRILALLHGLHDIKISIKQLNLGAHNGLQAQRICDAKYWISTHDEIKKEAGFITHFLKRRVLTLQEALEEERRDKGQSPENSQLADVRNITFVDVTNGESLLLA